MLSSHPSHLQVEYNGSHTSIPWWEHTSTDEYGAQYQYSWDNAKSRTLLGRRRRRGVSTITMLTNNYTTCGTRPRMQTGILTGTRGRDIGGGLSLGEMVVQSTSIGTSWTFLTSRAHQGRYQIRRYKIRFYYCCVKIPVVRHTPPRANETRRWLGIWLNVLPRK